VSNFDLSVLFFLQLAFILAVCRAVGWLASRIGQPQVVGEMIAGVVMGPSLYGTDHFEYRPGAWPHHPHAIYDDGADGGCDHPHDLAYL